MGNKEVLHSLLETTGKNVRKLAKTIELSFHGGVLHETECPAEGRSEELKVSRTIYGGGEIPLTGEVSVVGFMRCLDCDARGFPSFKTIVEDGERKKVERIFRKEAR